MATQLQKRTLEKVVEYGGMGKRIAKSRAIIEAGGSPNTAKTPSKVFESVGFLALTEELGLTDNFLTKALVADIKKKPGRRFKELELGFKVRGRLSPDGFDSIKPTTVQNFTQIIINPSGGKDAGDKSDAQTVLSVASAPEPGNS